MSPYPKTSTPYTGPISPDAPASRETHLRTPPHDKAAEQAVLGGMMMATGVVDDVTEILIGEDFYEPRHEMIFATIVALTHSGRPAEPIALADALEKRGALDTVGGTPYLHEVLAASPIAADATHYAEIVRDHSLRRKVISAGMKATQLGFDAHGEAADIADEAQQAIYAATENSRRETTPLAGSLLAETFDWLESDTPPGLSTGFPDVDRLVGGMQPGNMVIVAARPGMGKSTFAMDLARHNAIVQQVPTLFVSLEMSRQELMQRLLASQATVPLSAFKSKSLTDRQWEQVTKASGSIQNAPLWLEDRPGVTPLELRSKARQLRRQGLGLIVLDYLQLLSSGRRVESRQVEVSEFSRQIKLLAKELEIPVLALSQLNRSAEARADRMPALSDLRESGSLEQDADIVMLLHREEVNDPRTQRLGEADVIVPKNRNGQTGQVSLAFQGQFSRFTSLAH